MEKPNAIMETDVWNLDGQNEPHPLAMDPGVAHSTIRATVILLIACIAITALLYFMQH